MKIDYKIIIIKEGLNLLLNNECNNYFNHYIKQFFKYTVYSLVFFSGIYHKISFPSNKFLNKI